MRQRFDGQLALLNRELINMGALCEEAIAVTARSVLDADRKQAERISALEEEIDQKEREIERICLRLLLQQQPVAGDLRQISAALKMITDMERIGDQALDIAETAGFMGPLDEEDAGLFKSLAQIVVAMVTDSVDAFVKKDLGLARRVMAADDQVDALFAQVKRELIDLIAADSSRGELGLDLLMVAKYLERIGDHATTIADGVAYSLTGAHPGL